MIRALYTPTPARFLNEKMATTLSMQTKVKLRDNREIPVLGLGTYELDGDDAYRGVIWALEDSAEWYENEQECGRAILDFCKRENIPRSEIFYTTKLKYNNGYENVKQSIERSIKLCGLDYIDLYLIHGPRPQLSSTQASKADDNGQVRLVALKCGSRAGVLFATTTKMGNSRALGSVHLVSDTCGS
ncbi:aldo-keto [Moniliophthora roreri]|nr:aldo-keto [Moniliophthora roreri]